MRITSDDGNWSVLVEETWTATSAPCLGCGHKPTGTDFMLAPMRSAFSLCSVCVDSLTDLPARAEEGMY
jgi:hypothetical protein